MYYKKYCKILSKVVLAAKHMHFNKIIQNSENKIKSTWKIINEEKGKFKDSQNMKFLRINNKTVFNQEAMANTFNNYFLSVADSLCKDFKAVDNNMTPLHYLQNNLTKPENKMKWKYVTTYELEQIIKSLNLKTCTGMMESRIKL